jgi:hypothetical protein
MVNNGRCSIVPYGTLQRPKMLYVRNPAVICHTPCFLFALHPGGAQFIPGQNARALYITPHAATPCSQTALSGEQYSRVPKSTPVPRHRRVQRSTRGACSRQRSAHNVFGGETRERAHQTHAILRVQLRRRAGTSAVATACGQCSARRAGSARNHPTTEGCTCEAATSWGGRGCDALNCCRISTCSCGVMTAMIGCSIVWSCSVSNGVRPAIIVWSCCGVICERTSGCCCRTPT